MSRRPLLLLGGALVVIVGWVLTPHPLPLYDGVGFPDESYRYVQRPAGDTRVTPPPTAARTVQPLVAGTNQAEIVVASKEQGPQVLVSVPPHGLVTPVGTGTALLDVEPVAPGGTRPTDGTVDGNVYRVTVSTDRGPGGLSLTLGERGTIDLRDAILRSVGPEVEHRADPSAPWTLLPTDRVGSDIYRAGLAGVGDYLLVQRSARTGGGSSFPLTLTLASGGVVVVAVLLLTYVRVSRRREGAADTDELS